MDKIYCSNCGNLVAGTSNFCPYCGAPQHGPESALYRAKSPVVPQATVPAPEVLPAGRHKTHHKRRNHQHAHNVIIARRHLAPQAVWLFFLNYIGKTFVILLVLIAAIYFQPILGTIGLAAYLIITALIAMLVHNHFTFSVDSLSFDQEYGIIHKTHVGLPFSQIQNVNIARSFIDRILGIAKLEIETAGSDLRKKRDIVGGVRSNAEANLPGLTMEDAIYLHDLLLQKSLASKTGDF